MRILFAADVLPDPNAGASGTEVQTIAALRRLGHEVDEIWSPDLPRRIGHGNLHYLLELPAGYRAAIRRRRALHAYDVVHVNQGHSFLAARDHARRRAHGVFVFRSHGLETRGEEVFDHWRARQGIAKRRGFKSIPGRGLDALLLRHERLAVRHADGVIVSSGLDHEYLLRRLGRPPERVARIHQGVPPDFLALPPADLAGERARRLLYVGGFGFVKAPQTVAAVANALLTDSSDATLTWICRERDHAAAAALLQPAARDRTSFVAWTAQDELRRIYDAHGVLLFPSLFEGFGKAYAEASARGLCVVATPTGAMRDLIDDGRNGFVCDFGDSATMAARIRALWADPALARRMSAEARRTVEGYSWDRVGRETATFYEHLLALRDTH